MLLLHKYKTFEYVTIFAGFMIQSCSINFLHKKVFKGSYQTSDTF